VECAGVDVPAVPLGAWLETMAAASEDIPEIRIATALHAIEEGRHELAEQLLGQLAPDAGLTRERRAFLLELAQAARHGQATPALLEQWERVLAAFPDAAGPLRFAVEELFLIARIVRGRLQGQTLGALAGELHARARRGAEAR
jgi:hypothetical protein